MKKKSIIGLILTILLIFAAAGCSKETQTSSQTPTPAGQTESAGSTAESADSAVEDAAAVEEKSPEVKDIAESVMKNMDGVNSISQKMDIVFSAMFKSDASTMDMGMSMTMDIDANKTVSHSQNDVTLTTGGQDQKTSMEMYSVRADGQYTIYVSTDGKSWSTQTADAPADDSLYANNIFKAIAEGTTDASLRKETVKVNGEDAYVIDVTVSGELLSDTVSQMSSSMTGSMGDLSDFKASSSPVVLYVYADTLLPAGMEMDAAELGNSLVKAFFNAAGDDSNVEINSYAVKTVIDGFGNADDLAVPEEVKGASNGNVSVPSGSESETESAADADSAAANGSAGSDWTQMQLVMDGQQLQIPFPYKDISDSWTFDLADYGYENGYVMNPRDKVTGTISLTNEKYDKLRCTIGFMNTADEVKDILDTDIWSLTMDISSADTYPDILLAGGITWGSSTDEIIAKYGEPEEEPFVSEELGYTVYNWFTDFTYKMKLTVYDDGGLKAFTLEDYSN